MKVKLWKTTEMLDFVKALAHADRLKIVGMLAPETGE